LRFYNYYIYLFLYYFKINILPHITKKWAVKLPKYILNKTNYGIIADLYSNYCPINMPFCPFFALFCKFGVSCSVLQMGCSVYYELSVAYYTAVMMSQKNEKCCQATFALAVVDRLSAVAKIVPDIVYFSP